MLMILKRNLIEWFYLTDVKREQSYGLKGLTQEEIYREKISMFPLS